MLSVALMFPIYAIIHVAEIYFFIALCVKLE